MNFGELSFLVVDDDEFQRWMSEQLLQQLGVGAVHAAVDGRSALELIARDTVHVVISDLDMPGMDGLEFLRRLAAVPNAPAVIVASAHRDTTISAIESMAEVHGVRLLGSFAKPATAHKIAAAVRPYLDDSSARGEAPRGAAYPVDELREALRRGEIRAWFQPKLDLATGRMAGAEALARWQSRTGAVLLPPRFLPQVESEGLMPELTERILAQACRACARWIAAGLPGSVSVNVSPTSLADPGFAERLGVTVAGHGLHATQLILEITESAATGDLGAMLENAARLRMRGFGLSIDDFGTGYSSLQQLTRMPFSELKIDQSFVRTAITRQASRAVLESSIEVAAKLGIPAVAEGVETDEELALVRELGCRMVQGWRFARPMPVDELIATMAPS
jgi:EAL domain-containing protein (putative c-di-GMP-specific phosphodiesterase class I)